MHGLAGVVAIGSVRMVRVSSLSGDYLSIRVTGGVGRVGPGVLGVLTVEMVVGRVRCGSSGDGTGVIVRVSGLWVVDSDLFSSVTTPGVISLRLVVWVLLVVELLGRVELGRVAGGLAVGVAVSLDLGVDSLGLLVSVGVSTGSVVTTSGGSGSNSGKSEC